MKKRIKGILSILCVFLLASPAGALSASWSGRWISLQYGALNIHQAGNAFTAAWTGASAAGTISGRQASFRFWSGASFEKSADDSRGYGSLALSDDGNFITGTWANLSKKEPESGSFTAIRITSIIEILPQSPTPAPEDAPNTEAGIEPSPPDATPVPGTDFTQAGTEPGASAPETPDGAEPADELFLTGDLPPEYTGAFIEAVSDIGESFLQLFDFFEDGSGAQADTSPQTPDELNLTEDAPPEYRGPLMDFMNDIEESVLKFMDFFD